MPSPEVCYLVPGYNVEPFIRQTFESIALDHERSGVGDSTLIVLNDGSSDRTAHVLRELQTDLPMPVDVIESPVPSGEGGARAKLLARAHTVGAATYRFCDGDDIVVPGSTGALVDLMRSKELLAASGAVRIFGASEPQTVLEFPTEDLQIRRKIRNNAFVFCLAASLLNGSQLREKKYSPTPPPVTADLDMTYDLLSMGKLGSLADETYYYRRHPDSIMSKQRTQVMRQGFEIHKKHFFDPYLGTPTIQNVVAHGRRVVTSRLPEGQVERLRAIRNKFVKKL